MRNFPAMKPIFSTGTQRQHLPHKKRAEIPPSLPVRNRQKLCIPAASVAQCPRNTGERRRRNIRSRNDLGIRFPFGKQLCGGSTLRHLLDLLIRTKIGKERGKIFLCFAIFQSPVKDIQHRFAFLHTVLKTDPPATSAKTPASFHSSGCRTLPPACPLLRSVRPQ